MIISQILEQKEKEIAAAKASVPLSVLKELASGELPQSRDFRRAVSNGHRINLIAEIKHKSPSRGVICKDFDPVKIAQTYALCGANALSVLTDEKFFGGRLSFLQQAKKATRLPVLRKDFIIDEYQIYESRVNGADAVLLIADILSKERMAHFKKLADKLSMAAICEAHTAEDLSKVLDIKADIIGINNRNLHTFEVDKETTPRLAEGIPRGKVIISESGISTYEDIMYLKSIGVNAVLIGQAFMEAGDIAAKIKEMFHAT